MTTVCLRDPPDGLRGTSDRLRHERTSRWANRRRISTIASRTLSGAVPPMTSLLSSAAFIVSAVSRSVSNKGENVFQFCQWKRRPRLSTSFGFAHHLTDDFVRLGTKWHAMFYQVMGRFSGQQRIVARSVAQTLFMEPRSSHRASRNVRYRYRLIMCGEDGLLVFCKSRW